MVIRQVHTTLAGMVHHFAELILQCLLTRVGLSAECFVILEVFSVSSRVGRFEDLRTRSRLISNNCGLPRFEQQHWHAPLIHFFLPGV